jgi:hypothetical protein
MTWKIDRISVMGFCAAIVTVGALMVLWSTGFDEAFRLP